MPQTELFLIFLRLFNRAGFRYVIGGSVASIFYGEPRMTDDVDRAELLSWIQRQGVEAEWRQVTERR